MTSNDLIKRDRSLIQLWLLVCLLCVALMVAVGGYTRLSGSGLSITQWKPIHGAMPPLDEAQWQEEFDAYKTSPQYQKVNAGMSLEEFKEIFWPEFLHRLLGRIVGFVVLIPLAIFAVRKSLTKEFLTRLGGIFALGGIQGLVGWLMVASGLIDMPRVSHFKLALHLSFAFAIFALLLWTLLDVRLGARKSIKVYKRYYLWFALLCTQIIFGAFTAGLHAGLIYNTYPDMNGQMFPDGLLNAPLLQNVTFIQFTHRTLAILVATGFGLWWFLSQNHVKNRGLGKVCCGVGALLALQFGLGVTTLLHQVPLNLALMHQMTALLLFAFSVVLLHGLARDKNAD